MANRISTILDIDGTGFRGSLKSIGSAVGEADGLFGKFKAGTSAGFDAIKANAGLFSVAAGASLVAFGVKAVSAFTDTAKAAIDLSASSGLAVEDASRWIGVGDDYKVGADQLTASIGKIGKTLNDTKWAKYGIATRDAGGAARDVNDILLDSLTTLSDTKNETERARIGNELFGRGYANLSPLIGHTRSEYEKMLGSVEKGQVITQAEADRAEKFRLAEDQLADAMKEVGLQAGQALTKLAPLLVGLAKFVQLTAAAFGSGGIAGGGQFTEIHDALDDLDSQISKSGHSFDWWQSQIMKGKITLAEAVTQLNEFNDTTINSQTSAQGYSYALKSVADTAVEADQAVSDSTNAVDGYSYAAQSATDTVAGMQSRNKMMTDDLKRGLDADKAAMDHLLGVINDDEAWLNLQQNMADTAALFDDKGGVIVKKGDDAATSMRNAALAVDGLKKGVIDYGTSVLGLPTERITKIAAAVDPQSLADIEALLANLTRNRNVSLAIQAKGGAGYGGRDGDPDTALADGGIVMPRPGGTRATIAEAGVPEAVIPLDGKHGIGNTFHVTVNGVTDPYDISKQIAREVGWRLRAT